MEIIMLKDVQRAQPMYPLYSRSIFFTLFQASMFRIACPTTNAISRFYHYYYHHPQKGYISVIEFKLMQHKFKRKYFIQKHAHAPTDTDTYAHSTHHTAHSTQHTLQSSSLLNDLLDMLFSRNPRLLDKKVIL